MSVVTYDTAITIQANTRFSSKSNYGKIFALIQCSISPFLVFLLIHMVPRSLSVSVFLSHTHTYY